MSASSYTSSQYAQIEKARLRSKASMFLPAAAAKTSEMEVATAIWAGLGDCVHDLSTARTDTVTAMHITLNDSPICSPDKFVSQALAVQQLVSALGRLGQKVQSMETSMDKSRIHMKYLEADPNTVCWEFVKYGTCPRGHTCRWKHAIMTEFVICIAFMSSETLSSVADSLVTCRPKMLHEEHCEKETVLPNLFFSTVPYEAQKMPEEWAGDASVRSCCIEQSSFGFFEGGDFDKYEAPDGSTVDGSHGASDKADSVDGSHGSRERSESVDEGWELSLNASAEYDEGMERPDSESDAAAAAAEMEEDVLELQSSTASQTPLKMMNWADYDEDEDDPEMLKKLRVPRQAGTSGCQLPARD